MLFVCSMHVVTCLPTISAHYMCLPKPHNKGSDVNSKYLTTLNKFIENNLYNDVKKTVYGEMGGKWLTENGFNQ